MLLRVEVERDLAVSDLMEVATPPPPSSRTNWTRLVPPSVLSGHVSARAMTQRGVGSHGCRPPGPPGGLLPRDWSQVVKGREGNTSIRCQEGCRRKARRSGGNAKAVASARAAAGEAERGTAGRVF